MKKHGVLLNIINNSITFFSGYHIHFRALLFPIPPKSAAIKTILEAKQQNIALNQILKKGSDKNLDDFLRTT